MLSLLKLIENIEVKKRSKNSISVWLLTFSLSLPLGLHPTPSVAHARRCNVMACRYEFCSGGGRAVYKGNYCWEHFKRSALRRCLRSLLLAVGEIREDNSPGGVDDPVQRPGSCHWSGCSGTYALQEQPGDVHFCEVHNNRHWLRESLYTGERRVAQRAVEDLRTGQSHVSGSDTTFDSGQTQPFPEHWTASPPAVIGGSMSASASIIDMSTSPTVQSLSDESQTPTEPYRKRDSASPAAVIGGSLSASDITIDLLKFSTDQSLSDESQTTTEPYRERDSASPAAVIGVSLSASDITIDLLKSPTDQSLFDASPTTQPAHGTPHLPPPETKTDTDDSQETIPYPRPPSSQAHPEPIARPQTASVVVASATADSSQRKSTRKRARQQPDDAPKDFFCTCIKHPGGIGEAVTRSVFDHHKKNRGHLEYAGPPIFKAGTSSSSSNSSSSSSSSSSDSEKLTPASAPQSPDTDDSQETIPYPRPHPPTAYPERTRLTVLPDGLSPSSQAHSEPTAPPPTVFDTNAEPSHRCSWCWVTRADVELRLCGACLIFKYCGRMCQRAHWFSSHHHRCHRRRTV
jgi:hypothetical protein